MLSKTEVFKLRQSSERLIFCSQMIENQGRNIHVLLRNPSPPVRTRSKLRSSGEFRLLQNRIFSAAAIGRPRILHAFSASISSSQMRAQASEGILRSPRGETATEPTFGPSGRQLLLNCCEKNLR